MKHVLVLTLGLIVVSSVTYASTSGRLGSTSTGSVFISVSKPPQAQAVNVPDLTLANWKNDNATTLSADICMYSTTGHYRITASGSGLANNFTVADGKNTLPYAVRWSDGGAGHLQNSVHVLTAGTASQELDHANRVSAHCSTATSAEQDTARLIVTLPPALASANAHYSGTLTMLISPY